MVLPISDPSFASPATPKILAAEDRECYKVPLLDSSENRGLTWNCASQVSKGEERTILVSQWGIPKNVPFQTAQFNGKTFLFPSLQQGNLLASTPPHSCIDLSSSQIQDSDNVSWSLWIPTPCYGWVIRMLLSIYNAFILHIPMNQGWCLANSLCYDCKIEIRLPVGGKVAGSSILLSNDPKMAPPGQLLQAIMVSVSCVHTDQVQSLI